MSSIYFSTLYGGYGMASVVVQDRDAVVAPAPANDQPAIERVDSQIFNLAFGGVYGTSCSPCGFDPIPALSIPMIWRMRAYSAIALASNILVFAPILSSERSIEIVDDRGRPEEAKKIQQNATRDLLPAFAKALPGACESLHFAHWLQEIEWGRRDERTVPIDVHPILPMEATIHEDKFRKFSGFEINQQKRPAQYGFLCVNSPHIDPIRGYSRNQNALPDYWRAIKSSANADAIEKKASGRQMMLGLPTGQQFKKPDGTSITNEEMGRLIQEKASTGNPFIVPMHAFSKESIEKNPELAKVPFVSVEKFDWGDNGAALKAHLERMNALDRNMIRAWFHGEREATEGQHGTKAEAESHKAGGVFDCELVHASICGQWDEQVFATWIATNYGPEWIGCFKTKPAPLSDPMQEFLQGMVTTLIGAKDSETSLNLNERALLERTKTPVKDPEEVEKDRAEIEAQQAKDAKQQQPNNGNDKRVNQMVRRLGRRITG